MGFGSFIKKAVGVVLPVVGAIVGGPVGAAIGSAIATKVSTGSWRGWARNAAIGGATAWAGGGMAGKGWNPMAQSRAAYSGFRGGMQNLARGGTYRAGMRGATMSRGQQAALSNMSGRAAGANVGRGSMAARGASNVNMGQNFGGNPNISGGGFGGGMGQTAGNIGEFVKAYGPKAYNLASTGMKLIGAMEAEQAYSQLEQQMQSGGQLNQMAIDQLMAMEKNPEVYLNSPEVKAARDRAMSIVKRNAAAKGETYSTNAIQDYITQSLLVDTNAIANRRNYLQGMAQNPNQTLANLSVVQAGDQIQDQKQGALTEMGSEIFGEDNMLGKKGMFGA